MNLLSYFYPQLLETFNSRINGEIKVMECFGKYAIYVDGAPQSGAEIMPMWKKIIKTMKQCNNEAIKNCLVLGLGGGDVIKEINRNFPDISITAVELDPVMAEIAQKYFGLDSLKSLNIKINDAISYVSSHKSKDKYDLIVVDLFVGFTNPAKSRTEKYLKNIKRLLTNEGIVLFNSHYKPEDPDEFEMFNQLCENTFNKTEIIFSYKHNRVMLLKR